MKLSTRCRYGTRALVEIARRSNGVPVKRKDIAAAQGVTENYLENILSILQRRHFVKTIRGAGGGFVLARPPSQIMLIDVVRTLEGSIAPVECVENPDACDKSEGCSTRKVWKKLHEAQVNALGGISLQDMVDMEEKGGALNFAI
jgi:Rrf2 family protein